jgi:hypothetical protein
MAICRGVGNHLHLPHATGDSRWSGHLAAADRIRSPAVAEATVPRLVGLDDGVGEEPNAAQAEDLVDASRPNSDPEDEAAGAGGDMEPSPVGEGS